MKKIGWRIVITTITALWMTLIFSFSGQNGSVSSGVSNSFIERTIVKVYHIFDNECTLEEEKEIIDTFSFPIRKLAHFSVYFVLGMLSFFIMRAFDIERDFLYFAILFCFLFAMSDEIHQLFVMGRSGQFKDVLIDTFGSLISILFFYYRYT